MIPGRKPFTWATRHSPLWTPAPPNEQISLSQNLPFGDDCTLSALEIKNTGAKSTILFLSDLHWDSPQRDAYQALAKKITELNPDWLIIGGDMMGYLDALDGALDWLASIQVSKGKIAVAGNREAYVFWMKQDKWRDLYAEIGVTYLNNQLLETDTLRFYGTDDHRFGKPDWTKLKQNGKFTISICHNPDGVAEANMSYIGNLALCGHTHNGQYNFPLLGPLYTSSAYGKQFLHGLKHRSDGALCYISSGIGEAGFGILKHRLRCPREVLLLSLTTN